MKSVSCDGYLAACEKALMFSREFPLRTYGVYIWVGGDGGGYTVAETGTIDENELMVATICYRDGEAVDLDRCPNCDREGRRLRDGSLIIYQCGAESDIETGKLVTACPYY